MGRNPLSLDMGWKRNYGPVSIAKKTKSQSAFAGYGLEEDGAMLQNGNAGCVAIRFRWIWVGRGFKHCGIQRHSTCRNPLSLDMGWKSEMEVSCAWNKFVAIRFRWIWVGRAITPVQFTRNFFSSQSAFAGYGLEEQAKNSQQVKNNSRRNPLSLDMGWKRGAGVPNRKQNLLSQSAFAGYGLEEEFDVDRDDPLAASQSAFAGYGLEEEFDVDRDDPLAASQSAFAGYGLEERIQHTNWMLSDWSQSAFAGYGLEEDN